MLGLVGLSAAVGSALGWVGYDLLRRELGRYHAPWLLVAGVTLVAVPPLAGVVLALGVPLPATGYWLPASVSVGLNVAANYGFFLALSQSGLAATLPVLSLTPLLAALLGGLLAGDALSPQLLAGSLLAMAGGLALGWHGEGLRLTPGSRTMAGVALLWSLALVVDRRAVLAADSWFHALVLHSGVALGALLALRSRGELGRLRDLRRTPGLLLGAVGAGALALVLQLEALRTVPIGWVETLKRALGGVGALAAGAWIYREPVKLRHGVAVALLLGGLALALLAP